MDDRQIQTLIDSLNNAICLTSEIETGINEIETTTRKCCSTGSLETVMMQSLQNSIIKFVSIWVDIREAIHKINDSPN